MNRYIRRLAHPELGLGLGLELGSMRGASGPAINFDFTTGALPSAITFSRASSATRVNASGLIETVGTNVARFSHDPVTLAPRGLLIEPQRANMAIRSDEFDHAAWNKINVTVTPNDITAPDGSMTADRITDTTTNGGHVIYLTTPVNIFSGQLYAASFYVKYGNHRWITIRGDGPVTIWASFDLENGVLGSLAAGTTAAMIPAGNGWYRCIVMWTCAYTGNSTPLIQFANADVTTGVAYAGSGSDYFHLWGAQYETGGFASAHIPTAASQVTCTADSASFDIPGGVSELLYTFDDNSTQTVAVNAGAYTIPTNLNRQCIKKITSQ